MLYSQVPECTFLILKRQGRVIHRGHLRMSDNSNKFLMYHKWFGIRPEEMPTNAYRLLGISLYEEDADVIENAVQSRLNYVSQFLNGEHAGVARTIVDELRQVEQCLLNPELKATYDQQVRQAELERLAPTSVQAAAPIVVEADDTAATQLVAADTASNAPAFIPLSAPPKQPLARRHKGNPKKLGIELVKIVVGGAAGIGIGLVILMLVKSGREEPSDSEPDTPRPRTVRVAPEKTHNRATVERLESKPLAHQPEPPTSVDSTSSDNGSAQNSNDGQQPAVQEENPFVEENPFKEVSQDKTPSGTGEPDTTSNEDEPKPADPFGQLPKAVSLPSLLTRQPRELFSFGEVAADEVTLKLVSHAVNLPENQEFQILRDQDPSIAEWNVLLVDRGEQPDSCTSLPVASMAIADRSLTFHWLEEAVGTAARQFQNCLLHLVVGQRTHDLMLRQVETAEPLKIDLDQRTITRSVAMEQLPDIQQLQFEVTSFENFPTQTEFRNQKQIAEISGEIVLEMKQTGGAYLRIKTARRSDDELSLLVYPMFKVNAAEQIDLTTTRMASLKSGTAQALASAERDLAVNRSELKALESQYKSVNRMSNRNAAQALAKKQQLDAIASKAKSCNRRISSLQRRIPEMKARQAAIPQLEQLVSSLHNKAQLSIRIFVTIDGRDVTLYKAG
jgi:hypothetical protein